LKITARGNKRLMALLAFELVALVAIVAIVGHVARPAVSGPVNLTVYGFVKDNAGNPVDGAGVVVTDVQTTASQATTTDSSGFYIVEFDLAQWNVGDTIRVVATFNSVQEENTTTASDLGTEQVDINYTTEIPEFGSVAGSLVAVIAVAGVATLFVWKKPRRF
jgi:hypothetical protein